MKITLKVPDKAEVTLNDAESQHLLDWMGEATAPWEGSQGEEGLAVRKSIDAKLLQLIKNVEGLAREQICDWINKNIDIESRVTHEGRNGDLDYELKWFWALTYGYGFFDDISEEEAAEYRILGVPVIDDQEIDLCLADENFEKDIIPKLYEHYDFEE